MVESPETSLHKGFLQMDTLRSSFIRARCKSKFKCYRPWFIHDQRGVGILDANVYGPYSFTAPIARDIHYLLKKFERIRTDASCFGQLSSALTEENLQRIAELMVKSPETSSRKGSLQMDMSWSSYDLGANQSLNVIGHGWYAISQGLEFRMQMFMALISFTVPTARNIHYLLKKLERIGTVEDASRSRRLLSALIEENLQRIAELMVKSPETFSRKGSLQMDILWSSFIRARRKSKFTCYRPRLIHALNEDDPDRRLQHCVLMTIQLAVDPYKWLHYLVLVTKSAYPMQNLNSN